MSGRSENLAYADPATQEPRHGTADDRKILLTGRCIRLPMSGEDPMDPMAERIGDFAAYLRSERKSPTTIR